LESLTDTPNLDAEVLLAHVLGKNRSWLLAHPASLLSFGQLSTADQLVYQVISGQPLPYAIGCWEFFGLSFKVTSDVLIPRPETELLVEQAINWLHQLGMTQIIDVGTGCGCIAITIARSIRHCQITATDVSGKALKVASENVSHFGLSDRISLIKADLLAGIPDQFDLICANLPYIPSGRLDDLAVAKVEPVLALDGGEDGMIFNKKLLQQSKRI